MWVGGEGVLASFLSILCAHMCVCKGINMRDWNKEGRPSEREEPVIHTTTGQNIRLGGMHGDGAKVVRVSLKLMDALQSVVVKHSYVHVILNNKTQITVA